MSNQIPEESDLNSRKILRLAIVTNIPTPYRRPVFSILASFSDIKLKVFYCSEREPDREWDLSETPYEAEFLNERFYTVGDKFVHANPEVFLALRRFKPDVVIGTGFNPTHLIAFMYSRLYSCAYIPMTDGTLESERKLSFIHHWLRRFIYKRSQSYIAASDGGFDLYSAYGINDTKIFKSHLCANNKIFFDEPEQEKVYDLLFSGRFGELKNPLFAIEVAKRTAEKTGRKLSLGLLGSGPMEPEMIALVNQYSDFLDAHFIGFASQSELPKHYKKSKLLLFPTLADVWGVVANEALAAGVPVIVSPLAGCVPELIQHFVTGIVLPLEEELWANEAANLLLDEACYRSMVEAGLRVVSNYNYNNAAIGIARAAQHAVGIPIDVDENLHGNGRSLPARRRVAILQRRIPDYRIPLFNELKLLLAKDNIELILIQGTPNKKENLRFDEKILDWAIQVPCKYLFGERICWQNAGPYIRGAKLVIVAQENKLVFNYWLLYFRKHMQLAFWGHGRNLQATLENAISELFKKYFLHNCEWWFAYTPYTYKYLVDQKFPKEKITVLNNTVDSEMFCRQLNDVTPNILSTFSDLQGIPAGNICLFCGSLYKGKSIEFLIKAAVEIKRQVQDFVLVIVGTGENADTAKAAAKNYAWIKYLGPLHGEQKAIVFKLSKLLLIPSGVGLVVVDAICAGIPVVTRENAGHGPEICYIESKEFGIITKIDLDSYVNAVVNLLKNEEQRLRHVKSYLSIREKFTINSMANEFYNGISSVLSSEN